MKNIFVLFLLAATAIPAIEVPFGMNHDFIHFTNLTVAPFHYQASSSFNSRLGAQNLFDSNPSTYWYSAPSENDWVIVDFSNKRLMNTIEIEIPLYKGKRAVEKYIVQYYYKNDWHNLLENNRPAYENSHFIGNIDASRLRIFIPKKENSVSVIANIKIKLNDELLNGIHEQLINHDIPVINGALPDDTYSLPGAPRTYRNGVHKGIDFRHKYNSNGEKEPLDFTDKVVASQAGTVIRADHDYQPVTLKQYEEQLDVIKSYPVTYVTRDFGGRQIWIDHGNGLMTSYNHLSSINRRIKPGKKVKKGEVIGTVGNSGLSGEARGTDDGIHLHYEIWYKGEFLGKDLSTEQLKKALYYFFSYSSK